MRIVKLATIIAGTGFQLAAITLAAQDQKAVNQKVRINQIQVIGTHNSYHAGLAPAIAKLMQQKSPEILVQLDYRHADLTTQLNAGVRQIELDIFADAKGGRYAHPAGPDIAANAGLPADAPVDPEGKMLRPGFKVMHVQDIDYLSVCQPFVECLRQVRTWSHIHPDHVPIFILIETRQDVASKEIPMVVPEPFTISVLDALDAEIRSVFSKEEIITPDQVRGRFSTLEKAVLHGGWPTLDEARGKVVFLMDQKDVSPLYLQGHPSLRGRILFTNSEPGQPDAAFVEKNEGMAGKIADLVRQGYMVRTRADADTAEARKCDVRRRDEALGSGAQMVSTDYPAFEPARWTGYSVALPDGVAVRCNPVNAMAECKNAPLEAKHLAMEK
jgi:hypothetical protein